MARCGGRCRCSSGSGSGSRSKSRSRSKRRSGADVSATKRLNGDGVPMNTHCAERACGPRAARLGELNLLVLERQLDGRDRDAAHSATDDPSHHGRTNCNRLVGVDAQIERLSRGRAATGQSRTSRQRALRGDFSGLSCGQLFWSFGWWQLLLLVSFWSFGGPKAAHSVSLVDMGVPCRRSPRGWTGP